MSIDTTDLVLPTDRLAAGEVADTVVTEAENATDLVTDELLVEEISIDGMCGVY